MTNDIAPDLPPVPLPFGRWLISGCVALLLMSCSSYKGIESGLHLRQPSDYQTAASIPAQDGAWPDSSWAQKIGGAPLQALIDEALAGNPALHAAAAQVAAAHALAEAKGAAARPTVEGSVKGIYQRYTEYGLIPPRLAGQTRSDNQLALNFSYDLDFWGRHAATLRSAQSQVKSAEAERYAARLMLSTAIARTWLQLARQHAQLDLVERQLAIRKQIDHLSRLRLASGLDAQIESEQAKQQLAILRAEQAQWHEAIALTRNQMAALLGQGPDRGQHVPRPDLPSSAVLILPNELPLGLLGRRPDLTAARWRVEAALGNIDSAKAEFYPNVNLVAFAGLSSLGLANLLQSGSRFGGVGPAARLPVFEAGNLQAQLKGKVAAYDEAVASYNRALTDALREVADQLQSLRAAEAQLEHRRDATQAAANGLALAQRREQIGTVNMLAVLSNELNLLDQRRAELDIQARRAELQVGLIKALGGGFDSARHQLDLPMPSAGKQENAASTNRTVTAKPAP